VIEPDGSTVGSNGKAMLIVGPVSSKVKQAFPIKGETAEERIVVGEETAREVMKSIPRDTRFGGVLEHCDVRIDEGKSENVNFSITDGKRTRYIVGKRYERKYIDYKAILSRILNNRIEAKVIVNLRRLIALLNSIDKCCPDSSGNAAVYIEFSEEKDMLLRAVNLKTGQRMIGVMQSYKGVEGQWLEQDEWERRFYAGNGSGGGVGNRLSDVSGDISDVSAKESSKSGNRPLPRKIPKILKRSW